MTRNSTSQLESGVSSIRQALIGEVAGQSMPQSVDRVNW